MDKYRNDSMTQLGSEAPAFCVTAQPEPIYQPKYKLSLLLFALTFFSTLFVGAQLAISYKTNAPIENEVELLRYLSGNPAALTMGFPFAFTVLGFLMAHEMGHYFACRSGSLYQDQVSFSKSQGLI